MKNDVYQYVNQYIEKRLGKLKSGECKYLINHQDYFPNNPISKNVYRGINSLILSWVQEELMFNSSCWATFKQIAAAKGEVKKGSKATKILFFKFSYYSKSERISEAAYLKKFENNEKNLSKRPIYKLYSVFNLDQTIGLEHLNQTRETIDFVELEKPEMIISKTGATIEYTSGTRAFYTPSFDIISSPKKEFYISENRFYSVLFHELIHWTGNESRLSRDLSRTKEAYAFEELVAEIGAAYLLVNCEINDQLETNTAYIDGWLIALKSDKKFFFKATALATKASQFIQSF